MWGEESARRRIQDRHRSQGRNALGFSITVAASLSLSESQQRGCTWPTPWQAVNPCRGLRSIHRWPHIMDSSSSAISRSTSMAVFSKLVMPPYLRMCTISGLGDWLPASVATYMPVRFSSSDGPQSMVGRLACWSLCARTVTSVNTASSADCGQARRKDLTTSPG